MLTAKQWEVAKLVSEGWQNQHIAVNMGTTTNVVKNYLQRIYDKLGLWNRLELALWYIRHTETKDKHVECSQG